MKTTKEERIKIIISRITSYSSPGGQSGIGDLSGTYTIDARKLAEFLYDELIDKK